MKKKEYAERYFVFTVGLFLIAFGIALSIRSGLGVIPVLCPPYIASLVFGSVTVGQAVIVLYTLFLLVQMAIQRSRYSKRQYLQVFLSSIIFGILIDATNVFTQHLVPTHYWHSVVLILTSTLFIGLGVVFEVTSKLLLLPVEGLALAISGAAKISFGRVKRVFDITMLLVAVAMAYFFGWHLLVEQGAMREGTLVSVLLVGLIAGKIQSMIGPRITAWLNRHNEKDVVLDSNITVITIAREFGSGGHEIGQRIANELGWSFIDQQLINKVVCDSGLPTSFIAQYEQNMSVWQRIWKNMWMDNIQPVEESFSPEDRLFVAQSKIIREEAQKGACVIVGRCANWILRDSPNCFHVFVTASMPFARRRVMEEFKYEGEKAYDEIVRINQARANHYNYYTNTHWGAPNNYDLCVKSSSLGIAGAVTAIMRAIKK